MKIIQIFLIFNLLLGATTATALTRVFFQSSVGGNYASFYMTCANDDCSEISFYQGFADMYGRVHTQPLLRNLKSSTLQLVFTEMNLRSSANIKNHGFLIGNLKNLIPNPINQMVRKLNESSIWMASNQGKTKSVKVSEKNFSILLNRILPGFNNNDLESNWVIGRTAPRNSYF